MNDTPRKTLAETPASPHLLTVRKIGNSTGVIFPRELLVKMNLKEGDRLDVVEQTANSFRLSTYQPNFSRAMELSRTGMKRYHNALAELAK